MAAIDRFEAQAPRMGSLDVPVDTGAADALATVARASHQIAAELGQWADRKTVQEFTEKGYADNAGVEMPGVDFAFDKSSPATTPAGPVTLPAGTKPVQMTGMRADIRGIISQAAQKYGVDPNAMMRISMIESSGNPNAKNPTSSAGGLFQFIDSTAAQYGLANRYDPAQAADAAARLARDNSAHLRKVLGRDPTAGELYLAHQQGAGGAAKLLRNPNGDAVATVGSAAVRLNGGRAGMTNAQFAGLWMRKVGDVPPGIDPVQTAGVPATAPVMADPATGKVRVTLTGKAGKVKMMAAGTLAGDAYNKAALDLHLNRLDTAMRAQMDAVSLEHEGDPEGLTQALDQLRAGYVQDMPPQAAALVDQSFQRQKLALTRQAVNDFNQNLESQNLAAFEENIASRTNSAYRLAARGGLDETADAAIEGELGALTEAIDASPLNPLQKSRFKAEARSGVLSARVLGGFEAMKDPDQRAAYAQKFQQDWNSGEGLSGDIDAGTYQKINAELMRGVQADQVAAAKRSNALDNQIDGQIKLLEKGYPVTGPARAALSAEVAKTGDPALAQNLAFLDNLADWQKAHVAARPEVVDAQISAMKAKIHKEGASEAALTTLDVMEGLKSSMDKGLSTDPLGWANRAGVLTVEPLNFSDGSTPAASLTERVADARAVAQHYGREPKFFTPAEADGLKKMLKAEPRKLPSIVSSLSAGLGSATPRALAEISKEAPLLAHVAGLVHLTGDQRVSVEIAQALDHRMQPGYKSAMPTDGKLRAAASEFLGAATGAMPDGGIMEAASALTEARALDRGVSLEDFSEDGSPARAIYRQALDEVLGATTRDGVKYGGITSVNGRETIAPPDIAADSLQDMLDNMASDDLLFQQEIGSTNGVPVTVAQMKRGQLVFAGNGRYRLALGDIAGGDARYVELPGGGYWTLDAGMMQRSQKDRGALTPEAARTRRSSVIRQYGAQFDR